MVEFAGWELPVQYTSVVDEHRAVRTTAGLFDISHMAQCIVSGGGAEAWLQHMVTNDVSRLKDGHGLYAHLCNDRGGVVDDIYVFRTQTERYLLILNAAREQADADWLRAHLQDGVTLSFRETRGAMALQGPAATRIMEAVCPAACALSKNGIVVWQKGAEEAFVSRTGYTGEDGFEVFCSAEAAGDICDAICAAGEPLGLKPAGLGARDTLRLEMGYSLYGHELSEDISPFEAGLTWVVKLQKPGGFIGAEALARQRQEGPARKLVAFVLAGRAVPRDGSAVTGSAGEAGHVTSGTFSPSLGKGICLALVSSGAEGPWSVDVHGRALPAEQVELPFVGHGRSGAGCAK